MLMAPAAELAAWQARQADESPGPGKKGAKKPAAGKLSKADAASSNRPKPWYNQVPEHQAASRCPGLYLCLRRMSDTALSRLY